MELSSSKIKKFLIFFQKKAFIIFQEIGTPKTELFCISGSKLLSSKNKKPLKKFLIFQETELSWPKA